MPIGASQYSGVATKVWTISVVALSTVPPGRVAARVPSGMATAAAMPSAVSAKVIDTPSARPISSATGLPLAKE